MPLVCVDMVSSVVTPSDTLAAEIVNFEVFAVFGDGVYYVVPSLMGGLVSKDP